MSDDFAYALARLRKAAAGLPEVEEGTSYGTPALKVRGKLICRIKDPERSCSCARWRRRSC